MKRVIDYLRLEKVFREAGFPSIAEFVLWIATEEEKGLISTAIILDLKGVTKGEFSWERAKEVVTLQIGNSMQTPLEWMESLACTLDNDSPEAQKLFCYFEEVVRENLVINRQLVH